MLLAVIAGNGRRAGVSAVKHACSGVVRHPDGEFFFFQDALGGQEKAQQVGQFIAPLLAQKGELPGERFRRGQRRGT